MTDTAATNEQTLAEKAKGYAAAAQEKVGAAAGSTVEAAKEHPYAAAAIGAGVAAAVAGAALGVAKLRESDSADKPASGKPKAK